MTTAVTTGGVATTTTTADAATVTIDAARVRARIPFSATAATVDADVAVTNRSINNKTFPTEKPAKLLHVSWASLIKSLSQNRVR
jgi:hypothetical protein